MKNRKKLLLIIALTLLVLFALFAVTAVASAESEAERLLDSIIKIPPKISDDGRYVVLPRLSSDKYRVSIYGSSNESVIDKNGRIHTPLVDTEVKITYKITSVADSQTVAVDDSKETSMIIKGKYTASPTDNAEPPVLPKLREWKGESGTLVITDHSRIILNSSSLSSVGELAREYISGVTGFDIEVLCSPTSSAGDVVLLYVDSPELGAEGYTVEISDRVYITAYGSTGILYGATTVAQMLGLYEGFALPCGHIRDYPQYEIRAVMIDVARHYIPMEDLIEWSKYMAYFKVNTVRVHINDTAGEQPYAFRVESKKFPEINANLGDKIYTQDEYRSYQRLMLSYGINVITEIDSPGHAGFVNAYDPTLTAPSNTSLLNLSTEIHSTKDGVSYTYYDKSVEFMKELFDEFIGGDDPVVIDEIKTFHIGMDEYTLDQAQFKVYMKEMTEFVKSYGKIVQVWSALKTDDFLTELPIENDVTVNYWGFADFEKLIEHGFPCVANRPMELYVVPGGFSNSFVDRISLESLYTSYNVHDVSSTLTLSPSSPLLLGAEACLWNDTNVAASIEDLFARLRDQALIISEKCWFGPNSDGATASEFMSRVGALKHSVPGVNPDHYVEGNSDGIVAKYDFENIENGRVEDAYGRYDAELVGLDTLTLNQNTSLVLNGKGYLSLPFETLGYPYTVSFDLAYSGSRNGVLFGGRDGELIINHNGTGRIAYKRHMQTYEFPYVFEEGITYSISLVCDESDLRLYVNGVLDSAGIVYKMDTVYDSTKYVKFSTFALPTERIGVGVVGRLDNLCLSNVAESHISLDGLDLVGYGNVALGKKVTASGVEVSTKWGPENAVDGRKKADNANKKVSLNNADDAWLIIDLDEVCEVEKIVIEFSERPSKYRFLTSVDGQTWETVHEESALKGGSGGTDTVMLGNKEVRYVKYQTVEMFLAGNGYYYSGGFYEIEVYSGFVDNTVVERAEALTETLSADEAELISELTLLAKHICENNHYEEAGIALRALVTACDKLESGYKINGNIDRTRAISLLKLKKSAELYSPEIYKSYDYAYRFLIGAAMDPAVSAEILTLFADKVEACSLELVGSPVIETNIKFDHPERLADGSVSSSASSSVGQRVGDYVILRYSDGLILKSLRLVMNASAKMLGSANLLVSYDGESFTPVTTYGVSTLEESAIVIGSEATKSEVYFPKALSGVVAIKIEVTASSTKSLQINEIVINGVTDLDSIVSGVEGICESDYTESSFKYLAPLTRSMAVTRYYLDRVPTYMLYAVPRVNITELEELISRLASIDTAPYTDTSVKNLGACIDLAREFILSATADTTVYEGERVKEKLLFAEKLLFMRAEGVDSSALEGWIFRSVDGSQYAYNGYKSYVDLRSNAIEYLHSERPTQRACDLLASELSHVYSSLSARVFKDNLALGKNVTVSGLESGNDSTRAEMAVDGNETVSFDNRVCLNSSDAAWLTVDLGDVYLIDEIDLIWYTRAAKYKILVSTDGESWTLVHDEKNSGMEGRSAYDSIKLDLAVEARYVKYQQALRFIANAEKNYRYSGAFSEIKVIGCDSSPFIADLEYRYGLYKDLDTALMHPECAELSALALKRAEELLSSSAPIQEDIDGALASLVAHSELEWRECGNERSFVCSCGRKYNEGVKNVVLDSAFVRVLENIDMIYVFSVRDGIEILSSELEFLGKKTVGEAPVRLEEGKYELRFDKIMPQYMTETVFVKLSCRDRDGNLFEVDCEGISVRDYAILALKQYESDIKLTALISDLLRYGAAAQRYTGYKTDDLATDGVELVGGSVFSLPESVLSLSESDGSIAFRDAGLDLGGSIGLYLTFDAESIDGIEVKIISRGRETVCKASELRRTVDGAYRINCSGIMAHELYEPITVEILRNGESVGNVVTYSAASYLSAMSASEDGELSELLQALYCYGRSAIEYNAGITVR